MVSLGAYAKGKVYATNQQEQFELEMLYLGTEKVNHEIQLLFENPFQQFGTAEENKKPD